VAPFHQWTPDVYEGAPTPVTAFMAVTTKVAALGVFLRFFDVVLIGAQPNWGPRCWRRSRSSSATSARSAGRWGRSERGAAPTPPAYAARTSVQGRGIALCARA
jgi:hypothetical protein